ncbi:hypothetical protein SESBI_02033 [Sesbania bispinosa]|nr:hypothetical protein SESBI_02033 [Sesbania bispinosa]
MLKIPTWKPRPRLIKRRCLEKALNELEETQSKLKDDESELGEWSEKYETALTKFEPESYFNTVEQLKILNPGLVVYGSDPYAYVKDGIIMEDSINGPIPFVPRGEDVGDSKPTPTQGPVPTLEQENKDPTPSPTQQQPFKDYPEVAYKDEAIHID